MLTWKRFYVDDNDTEVFQLLSGFVQDTFVPKRCWLGTDHVQRIVIDDDTVRLKEIAIRESQVREIYILFIFP